MVFLKHSSSLLIGTFHLKVNPGNKDRPVAFGPGSVINGSVLLTLNHSKVPIVAYNIRVVFKCDIKDYEKRTSSTVFSISSLLWGKENLEGRNAGAMALDSGASQYLFGIKLPHCNLPPSIRRALEVGYQVDYSLQAFLNLPDTTLSTEPVEVIYFPLVTDVPQALSNAPTLNREDMSSPFTAELVKPAYCPGDTCTIKLTLNDQRVYKVSQVQLELVATVKVPALSTTETTQSDTAILPTHHQQSGQRQHIIHKETVPVPKNAGKRDYPAILRLDIPANIVPTFQTLSGKYLSITYEVVLKTPLPGAASSSWLSMVYSSPTTFAVTLPMTIITVPSTYQIHLSGDNSSESELPSFVPNFESPIPSPYSPTFSPGGSACGSPLTGPEGLSVSPTTSHLELDDYETRQDAAGLLMVPSLGDTMGQTRRKSAASSATGMSDMSNTSPNSQLTVS